MATTRISRAATPLGADSLSLDPTAANLQRQLEFQELEIECYRSQLLGASIGQLHRLELAHPKPVQVSAGREKSGGVGTTSTNNECKLGQILSMAEELQQRWALPGVRTQGGGDCSQGGSGCCPLSTFGVGVGGQTDGPDCCGTPTCLNANNPTTGVTPPQQPCRRSATAASPGRKIWQGHWRGLGLMRGHWWSRHFPSLPLRDCAGQVAGFP
jgi:hypothetical protein